MSRYRVKLLPASPIRPPLEVGVRLTKKPVATTEIVATECEECEECPCVSEWEGWGITVDGETATGTPIPFQNDTADPIAIRVDHVGELCPDDCIEWEVRAVVDEMDVLSEDLTVTPDGCGAVDLTLAHEELERYAGLVFAIFATVNGQPFGETVIVAVNAACEVDFCDDVFINYGDVEAWTAESHYNLALDYSWNYSALNQYANYLITGISVHVPPVDLCGHEPEEIDWVVTTNGAASDLLIMPFGFTSDDGFGNWIWTWSVGYDDGAGDFSSDETRPFTGSEIYITPHIDGQPLCAPAVFVELNTNPF